MSGLEVVSVLLGAIPLVVSALSSYKATKQRYIWFASKDVYINRLIQSLNEQIFFIRADVSLALRAAGLEEETLTKFLDDPDFNHLHAIDAEDALQDYFGDGFQIYIDCLCNCRQIVCEIVKNLNGLIESKNEINDLSAIVKANPKKNGRFEFAKRIKFSLQKDDLDAQIRDLNRSTKLLSRINGQTTRGEAVAVQLPSRTVTKFASSLPNIREAARRLYSAISRGYVEHCHIEHEVKLFLQPRSTLLQNTKQKPLNRIPVAFEVLFSPAPVSSDKDLWSYRTEIKVAEGDEIPDNCKNKPSDQLQSLVTFNLPEPDPPDINSPLLNEIEDLCALIHTSHEHGTCSQLFLSRSGKLCSPRQSKISRASMVAAGGTSELPSAFVTLDQILAKSSPAVPKLSLNYRIALAFNIASSVMQLHSTPWLAMPLTSSSICFMHGDIHGGGRQGYYTQPQPFIRAVFANCRKGCSKCHNKARDAMLELGILLLELWDARSIDTFAVESGLRIDKTFGTRYEVAREWILQSEGDMMLFYLEAATRCIECTFATSSSRLEWNDVAFQKSVCQYVLKPLLDNCPAKYR